MRILMFGWEYPPDITGGLGTACRGLANGLVGRGSRLTFVAPRLSPESVGADFELLSAEDVEVELQTEPPRRGANSHGPMLRSSQELRDAVVDGLTGGPAALASLLIDSPLQPYANAQQYAQARAGLFGRGGRADGAAAAPADGSAASDDDAHAMGADGELAGERAPRRRERLRFAGGYGPTLFDEIVRYGAVAGALVARERFDVIHAHDWMTFPAAIEARQRSGRPLVVHVHALEYDRVSGGHQADVRVVAAERAGLEAADAVIAVSRRTRDMITHHYGIDPAKVRVVHNGAEPARETRPLPHRLPGQTVVFLGRITMQKGPEYFLDAAYLVAQRYPGARFIMAGNGDLRPRMIERMAALDLQDRFHFTGFVDEGRRAALLAGADCFVLSSVSEPFGLTPVEALQYGVPVVVSRQSGVSEVLQGAIKVDFWDVRRMAEAIVHILSDRALAQQLREDGRRDIDKLTWDEAARQVLDVYAEVTK